MTGPDAPGFGAAGAVEMPERDPGLTMALDRAGGVRSLARKLNDMPGCGSLRWQSVQGWRRVPKARVEDVSRVTGLDPEQIRPDLAEWFEAARVRRWKARVSAMALAGHPQAVPAEEIMTYAPVMGSDVLDLGLILAAFRFVAERRQMDWRTVWTHPVGGAGAVPGGDPRHGASTPEQAARARAVALAAVIGRVSQETIASVIGFSRQNVSNCIERYLRSRDGDDPEVVEGGYVMERGRRRRAKSGDDAVWLEELAFHDWLIGRMFNTPEAADVEAMA